MLNAFGVALGMTVVADTLNVGDQIIMTNDPYWLRMVKRALIGMAYSNVQGRVYEAVQDRYS